MEPSPYQEELLNTRVLVLVENEPGSNTYGQMELTREQYMVLLNVLESFCEHPGDGSFVIPIVEDSETPLKELQAHL